MKSLILLAPQDNCLVACRDLLVGETVVIDGQDLTLLVAVPCGYKLARLALAPGEKVLRYGAPIGSATRPIAIGDLIHTHNLKSDYLPTYLREGGGSFVSSETSHE